VLVRERDDQRRGARADTRSAAGQGLPLSAMRRRRLSGRRASTRIFDPREGTGALKVIGLLGGMSWESTVPYYRHINERVREKLGGLHSAKIVLYSVDFAEIERLQHLGEWEQAGARLAEAARAVERAGADCLVLCTNTMHRVAPAIEKAVRIPLLHIADATADEIRAAGHSIVALLGTRFTMEQDFYKGRMEERHGVCILVPPEADRALVHAVIYEELCLGRIVERSREEYRRIMRGLVARGAQAIVLGCTEISLLIGQADSPVPIFDTTAIHARKAAEWAVSTA
jgi:aspartate racemase